MLRLYNEKKISRKEMNAIGEKFHDTHTWCVMDGKVIDPTDISPGNEWAINFLKLEETPMYVPYDDDTQKLFMEEFIFRKVLEETTPNTPKRPDFYKNPEFGYCYYNAWAFKQHNPTAKIVFGAVVFKYKKKKGKKNRNQKPRYWVQYGEYEGNTAHSDDTGDKASKYAITHGDKTLQLQIAKNLYYNERQSEVGHGWDFVYNTKTGKARYSPPTPNIIYYKT